MYVHKVVLSGTHARTHNNKTQNKHITTTNNINVKTMYKKFKPWFASKHSKYKLARRSLVLRLEVKSKISSTWGR